MRENEYTPLNGKSIIQEANSKGPTQACCASFVSVLKDNRTPVDQDESRAADSGTNTKLCIPNYSQVPLIFNPGPPFIII